jgi:hypothetical protein
MPNILLPPPPGLQTRKAQGEFYLLPLLLDGSEFPECGGSEFPELTLETDWTKIEEKIQAAENGIGARLHEFSLNHGGTPEENQAIVDALHGLDVLRKDVAAWQGSQRAG